MTVMETLYWVFSVVPSCSKILWLICLVHFAESWKQNEIFLWEMHWNVWSMMQLSETVSICFMIKLKYIPWLLGWQIFMDFWKKSNVYSNKTTQVHIMYKMGWYRIVILGKAILDTNEIKSLMRRKRNFKEKIPWRIWYCN